MNVLAYSGTALAALANKDVHTLMFDNLQVLPETAKQFDCMQNALAPSSALTDYVASPEAVKHIESKFKDFVFNVTRDCHVMSGIGPSTDPWKCDRGEIKRSLVKLPLASFLSISTLVSELRSIRTGEEDDKDAPKNFQAKRDWMVKTHLSSSVELILDAKGRTKLKSITVAELESALDGSIFRVTPPDRRFHHFGVTASLTGPCMLLEATVDSGSSNVLIDDSGDETTLLFRYMPASDQMMATLKQMLILQTRTRGLRTA